MILRVFFSTFLAVHTRRLQRLNFITLRCLSPSCHGDYLSHSFHLQISGFVSNYAAERMMARVTEVDLFPILVLGVYSRFHFGFQCFFSRSLDPFEKEVFHFFSHTPAKHTGPTKPLQFRPEWSDKLAKVTSRCPVPKFSSETFLSFLTTAWKV